MAPASGATQELRRELLVDVPLEAPPGGAPQLAEGSSPEAEAGCWQWVTFSWLSPIIAEGYRRELRRQAVDTAAAEALPEELLALTEADLYELRPDDRAAFLSTIAEKVWEQEQRRETGQRSLRRALRIGFAFPFFVAGLYKFIYDSLQMVGPYVLREFLRYLNGCEAEHKEGHVCDPSTGYSWVLVIFATSLVQTAMLHQYFHRCFRTGMRLNAATIYLVYRKALLISGPGRKAEDAAQSAAGEEGATRPQQTQWTTGEIVNLMSVDANRIQMTITYLHTLWSGPYQIVITLIFLFLIVRWATFAGLAVMLLQIPLVSFVARRVKLAQRELMKKKDERVKVTNEVFSSIRLLKMYGWEESFEKRLDGIREAELKFLRRYQLLNIISSAMWSVAPILTGVGTFAVYTALYGTLEAGVAFSALSLFNVLRFPLTMFPQMITSAVEANVALGRLQSFLESPEIRGRPMTVPLENKGVTATAAIQLQNAKFQWPGGIPLLSDVTFSVPAPVRGQTRAHMTVIIGAVGVGKSGLLQALIGDLGPVSGPESVVVRGTIAYASQVAWIRNATVKDNIIFNLPYNEDRYKAVVKACALLPDMEALPNGEATEIGEKGVNLSGGQKQRVSLARAVYANAELLLLDDPLSAVDAEVAKKLLMMLRGPLVESSSIVLCTHYLGAIWHADQVIVLERSAPQQDKEGSPSQATTEAFVAFCGSPDEFRTKYPEKAQGEEALTRQESEGKESIAVGEKGDKGKLVQKELEQQGSVPFRVYKAYIDAAGGTPIAVAVLLGLIFGQASQVAADTWVSFWSDHSKETVEGLHVSSAVGLVGYVITSFAAFFGIIFTSTLFRTTALRAARSFHKQLLSKMLQLPMRFYDTTPLGRVLNRFSGDVYTVDEQLVSSLMMYFQTLCRVLGTIVVICFATPWFLLVIVPLMAVYRRTQIYYVPSSRQLKRIESNLRSPIFSHFAETLDGVSSIRAFGQQQQFTIENLSRVQRNMRAYYVNVASNRWLAVRLETLGTVIVAAATLLAVIARVEISAGVAGLSITYALSVTQSLNWVVRMTSERETNIVSVERLSEYIRETPEPPRWKQTDPAEHWPERGAIHFDSVQLRYRPGLPLVLNSLSLEVRPQEKVGICGRTGAGKSSLLNVLLRIVEQEGGQTSIDAVDIAQIGLHRLRRSITVLPQDPVLFSGDLRFNLDPLKENTDSRIWEALRRAHLTEHAKALASATANGASGGAQRPEPSISDCLDAVVSEKGENFSLGQRQQACLARALLRSNKILLLDEATSAVDVDTDALIQTTIREDFANHTILCIAHRISTIIGFDRVCVIDAGRVVEEGPPQELCKQVGSRFRLLADQDASR